MPRPAAHLDNVRVSQIREVTELAWRTPGTVILSVGEPDFPTAPHILRGSIEALERDDTRYTPNAGIEPLREAIAARHRQAGHSAVTPDRVWVTAGGAEAILFALRLTIGAGDEVLVPNPGYPPFVMTTQVLQGVPVEYPLAAAHGFVPDPAVIESLITDRTRVLVLNSPSNPLGTVIGAERMAALVALARRHDLWVLSDECYGAFADPSTYVSALEFDTDDRVITLESFSKTYAMTGFRVASLIVPAAFDPYLGRVQETLVSCVNSPAQYGAIAALTGPQDEVEVAAETYARRRTLATKLLSEAGIAFAPSGGGMYVWAQIDAGPHTDVHVAALRLIAEHGVAVAPGTAFGSQGEGWVRIALTASDDDLAAGLRRLIAGIRAIAGRPETQRI